MSFLRKIGIVLFTALLVTITVPSPSLAEDLTNGTIIIKVIAENGENVSGNWYLHRGTTENGYLIRNGSFGETFQAEEGYYYLDVRGLSNRPYFIRYSKNPQFLYGGSTITFSVQYFKTQEEMLAASGDPTAAQVMETTSVGLETNDIYDIYGCNSTRGYVWCARTQACTKFWSPTCRVTVSEDTSDGVAEAESDVGVPAVTSPIVLPNSPYVPTFETAPVGSGTANINTAIEGENDIRLVQTGSSAILLFIASVLLSSGMLRLFYTRRRLP